MIDAALSFLDCRCSSMSVDFWTKDVCAEDVNNLLDALKACPYDKHPSRIFDEFGSEAAVVSFVKLYLRRLPSE